MEELLEENMVLQTQQKQRMSKPAHLVWELEQLSEDTDLSDDLSDASRKSSMLGVKECASSHILKLEKERQSLQSTIRDASQGLPQKAREVPLRPSSQQASDMTADPSPWIISCSSSAETGLAVCPPLQHDLAPCVSGNPAVVAAGPGACGLTLRIVDRAKDESRRVRSGEPTRPGQGQQLTEATQEPGSPLPAQPVSAVAVARPQEVGGKKVFLENSSVEIFYGADSFGFALKHSSLAKLTFIWAGSRALQIEKLQHELEGEKQTINDLQSFSEELFEEKEEMRSDMQMLRADSMRQIQVLEKEKDLLNQSMLLLQVASLGGSEAYTKDIEEENKLLQLTVTDTSRKLSKLEFEKQSLQRDMEQMQERMKQVEELEKKLHCLEKENKKLSQEFTSLTMTTTENMDALERENQDLRLKNQELSKSVDTLQIMSVQLEGLEQDNRKLHRMVKTMSIMRANMAQIEMQNQELEQEEEDLKALSRKWESLELSPQSMSAENMQLRQTLDSSSQKAQALQQELQEPQAENLAQQQDLEAQQLANKQLECSEDNKALELEVAWLEKDRKLLEEAGNQPQQQVELEDAVLDDRATKLSIALDQEMAHCKDVATELKKLEKNNRHFTKKVSTHMKRLRTLRVDLVLEKVKSEQLSTKLDKLSQELETRGRRQELLLQDNSSHSNAHKDVLKPQVEQGAMETVLNTECGAQQQEQRTDAIAESENQRLRDELDRANFLRHLWKGDREELNTHVRKLENSLHYSQLQLCHLQAQFNQLKEQHQSLDNHSELLSHLKENLEKENHHLMGQLNMLNQQNQELLEQNMKSKEQYYEEQKQSM
ncbi:protein Daple-like [Molossus nigricans]